MATIPRWRRSCDPGAGARARRGPTELEVPFSTRDVQRAFVGPQVRPPGDCAAPEWSLHRRASCGQPNSPAQCASSGESPVGRTPPALERLRVSPRAFRDRALESSSSLAKCSCFKIRCIFCRLQGGVSSSHPRIEERELEAGGLNQRRLTLAYPEHPCRVPYALRRPRSVADGVPSLGSHEDDRPLAQNHHASIHLYPAIAVSEPTKTDLLAVDPQLPRHTSPETVDLLLRRKEPVPDKDASKGRQLTAGSRSAAGTSNDRIADTVEEPSVGVSLDTLDDDHSIDGSSWIDRAPSLACCECARRQGQHSNARGHTHRTQMGKATRRHLPESGYSPEAAESTLPSDLHTS